MGTSTIIAGLHTELTHTVSGMTTDTLNEKHGYIRKLLTTLEAHQSVENNINRNERLSQAGKLDALKRLGTETTGPALKWLRTEITRLQEKEQHLQSQLFTITSGIDNAVERMLKYTYLWSRLDLLDQSARVTKFLEASERDHDLILSAMLEHPFGAMVNEEVKERALITRAKRLFPRDYENFEQNAILLEFLVTFRDWIARWLNQEVGVDLAVIRISLGDKIAEALTTQVTGIPQRQDAA